MVAFAACAAAQQGPPPGNNGPFFHQIYSASSPDGLTWTEDGQMLIDHASVPAAFALPDGRIRIYYVDASQRPENVNCAESTDGGLTYHTLPFQIVGLSSVKAVDPSIVQLPNGRFRLYYYASSNDVGAAGDHSVNCAISDDGVTFYEERHALTYPGLVDPDVFWNGKKWVMFVFSLDDHTTVVAESKKGRVFKRVRPLSLTGWGTTAPVQLDDGRFRLYAFDQVHGQREIGSFTSTDGFSWTQEPGIRLTAPTGKQITDPFVVHLPDGSWKMVYKLSDDPQP